MPMASAFQATDVLGQRAFGAGATPGGSASADQIALTGPGYSSPTQSGCDMAIVNQTVVSPLFGLLGLALAVATPVIVMAMNLPAADKAAVVETVLDQVAEWDVPGANRVIIDQRIVAALPAGLAPNRRATTLD